MYDFALVKLTAGNLAWLAETPTLVNRTKESAVAAKNLNRIKIPPDYR
jgi:hypothetical protein